MSPAWAKAYRLRALLDQALSREQRKELDAYLMAYREALLAQYYTRQRPPEPPEAPKRR